MNGQNKPLDVSLWTAIPELREAKCLSGETFVGFYMQIEGRPLLASLPRYIIAIDPGETTGVCVYSNGVFYPFQKNTSIIEWAADFLNLLICSHDTLVVAESYRIYAWRTKQHTWASLLTPRIIGGIETLCRLREIPLIMQSAQMGKGFMTDDRLKGWDLYTPGKPHQNDATRHLCQLLLFGDWK